jgi:succinate dehydrogenase / fumarate reductase membrane anchor subunit
MTTRAVEKKRSGTWIWQALTGVLLVILLSLHMIVHHFVVEGGLRDYQQVLAYVGNPLIVAIEVAFLAVVTYHALVGVRAILFDLNLSERSKTWITRLLVVLGAVLLAWGVFLAFYLFRVASA